MRNEKILNPTNIEGIKNTLNINRVQIVEKGKIIDESTIQKIESLNHQTIIEIKSLKLYPGQKHRFLFIGDNRWILLFKDPGTGTLCYSNNAPDYEIKLC